MKNDASKDRPPALAPRRGMSRAILLLGAVALAGCAQKMVYLTTDGRAVAGDPALSQQLALDRVICENEMAKSVQGGDHGDGSSTRGVEVARVGDECMAEKGYVAVRQDEAAAKQRELAANADQARGGAPATPPRN
jgi:hypothetical protein